jgi:acetyl esterase/lipase
MNRKAKRPAAGRDDFHPDLRTFARLLPRHLVGPSTLRLMRMVGPSTLRLVLTLTAVQRPWRHTDVEVLALPSGARVRMHRPAAHSAAPWPALLWMHGGGYILGRAKHDDNLCRRFVQALGVTVASVDYRLAPEHPFPAALDDCFSALTWLADLPAVDPARVAIGGASAGGGLAAALALRARDDGEVRPVLQLLVYPMLDDRTVRRSDLDGSRYRLWSQDSNRFGWTSYLAGADPQVAVPARHGDLAGLPPAWVGVGTRDLFYDEDLAYAGRLNAAGVACRVEVVPGAFHIFDAVLPKAGVSRSFFASQCASLREAFAARRQAGGPVLG